MKIPSRVWVATGAVVAVSGLVELAFHHLAHVEYWWHSLPTFDFLYGFAGCVAIVLGSKWLGKTFLQRNENYYQRDR